MRAPSDILTRDNPVVQYDTAAVIPIVTSLCGASYNACVIVIVLISEGHVF